MNLIEKGLPRSFGHRKVKPRVLVLDPKPHVGNYLKEALEEEGFLAETQPEGIGNSFDLELVDLALVSFNSIGGEARQALETLNAHMFRGKVMLFGPYPSQTAQALQELGARLRLNMLPLLATPFTEHKLRENVSSLLREPVANPPVDAEEAVEAGWLELWYQSKFDTQSLTVTGAEGLIRMRHPTWGVVLPAYFIPADSDPCFRKLSEFVICRAVEDWYRFVGEGRRMQLAINVPISFLEHPDTLRLLRELLPDHPAFDGMIFEINGTELVHNLPLARDIANELRFYNVSVAIDDIGAEWPALLELDSFPFFQIKINRQFVHGVSDDKLKAIVCRRIVEFSQHHGARTVAKGVETMADFHELRSMQVNEVQGFLFGKPMPSSKFSHTSAMFSPVKS